MKDALLSDQRFDLDDEFVYRRLESLRVCEYRVTSMRLGDINRIWFDGSVIPLKESAPYSYLYGDDKTYDEYCHFHFEHNLFPVSRERFDTLIKSIETNGFDQRKVIVVQEKDNRLLDGQHRLCLLLKQYGEDFVVPVVKLQINDKGM